MKISAQLLVSAAILGASVPLQAQVAAPGPRPDAQFDMMNVLTDHRLHNIDDERWNVYGQLTYISSWKLRFPAAYSNAGGSINSLLTTPERSYTGTATLYFGMRLWPGAEGYFVPEVISEQPLSQLRGLGGAIQNFELQKGGSPTPQLYRSRAFIKQTVELGGDPVIKASDPMQLGTVYQRRRLVFAVGNFSILDFFDRNAFGIDPRQGFNSLAFLTYSAYDFASDARGYSWGGVAELYWDNWAIRFGRITPPQDPNQLAVDFRLDRHFGDQIEIEHQHRIRGQLGTARLLAYRNQEKMGRFRDAVAAFQSDPGRNATTCTGFNYGSGNVNAPDLCWARKLNVKVGAGLYVDQNLTHNLGIFFRGMASDGSTEVYSYTSTDRSASWGVLGKGGLWSRAQDIAGVAVNLGWISRAHADYLRLGGVDAFIGDGNLHPAMESTFDIFYSLNFLSSIWLSGDYQHITHPAFNADRGPVDIFGARLHAEF